MTVRSVHWHEGMFLWPHQMQMAERYGLAQVQRGAGWDLHHNWGLRRIDLDRDALASYRLVVRALEARMRDGTLAAVPADGTLAPLELKEAWPPDGTVVVFLALPKLQTGKPNLGAHAAEGARYLLDSQDLEDENTGLDTTAVQVRLLNLKLLLTTDDKTGYELLPIARLVKSD